MSGTVTVDQELAARLRLVVMRLARRLRQQSEGDATASQLSALGSVLKLGPVTLGELAAVEQVRPPSMTRIVAALEEAGLVEREVDPRDRRVARVRASQKGQRFAERARARGHVYLSQRLAALGADELADLERAVAILDRLTDSPPQART
jgi:DNA-binding MarR family transcriptional regulator